MKKWIYLIFPTIALGIFLVFYLASLKETERRETAHAAKMAEEKKVADAKKAEAEAKAREDAIKRAAQKAQEDAEKEAKKAAEWKAEGDRIQADTNDFSSRADKLGKEASDLEIKLSALHRKKDQANRDMFEATKRVERAKVDQQTAEKDSHRLIDMIAKRANDSSLARPPAPPALPGTGG